MAIIAVEITCQCYIFSCVKLVSWPAFPLICLLDSDVRNVQVVGYVLSVSPRVHEGYIIVSVSTDEKFVNGYYEIWNRAPISFSDSLQHFFAIFAR